ncbi:hypothetical protein ACFL4A_01680 [bacterium]
MNFFKKLFHKKKILLRCNYCNAEISAAIKDVQQLEIENANDPLCPVKEECHYCHMGFVLPVFYKSKNGKIYKFDELAKKIAHLDENQLLERIFHEDHF